MAKEPRAVWERRVARWAKSGLSREQFAAREGVKPATLGWWRWFLDGKARQPSKALVKSDARFVEVGPVILEPAVSAHIEIVLPNGRVVRIPAAFDEVAFGRVLAVAERR